MSLEVCYEITTVNTDAKCMEILYSAPGKSPVLVGARLPYLGEAIESVAASYSPFKTTPIQEHQYAIVEVGASGKIIPKSEAEIALQVKNSEMWKQIEFDKSIAAALVRFGLLPSDPTTIGVTTL